MKVTDAYAALAGRRPLIACDFSPPRSSSTAFAQDAASLDADFICVAYAPGKSVRMGSVAAAAIIQRDAHKGTIFNLATRDMNRLAIQTHLLEAEALGLENVLVLRGDAFTERDLRLVQPAGGYSPTELLRSIQEMNRGRDFRGVALQQPTHLCAGAAIDFDRPLLEQARLVANKVETGAEFFVTQPLYDGSRVTEFLSLYQSVAAKPLTAPVLYGVAVLVKDGIAFGPVPHAFRDDLAKGRSGQDIALQVVESLTAAGCCAFYIVPPILKGGVRDYQAAQQVIRELRRAA